MDRIQWPDPAWIGYAAVVALAPSAAADVRFKTDASTDTVVAECAHVLQFDDAPDTGGANDVVLLEEGRATILLDTWRFGVPLELSTGVLGLAVLPGGGGAGLDAVAAVKQDGLHVYRYDPLSPEGFEDSFESDAGWDGVTSCWAGTHDGKPVLIGYREESPALARLVLDAGALEALGDLPTVFPVLDAATGDYDDDPGEEIAFVGDGVVQVRDWNSGAILLHLPTGSTAPSGALSHDEIELVRTPYGADPETCGNTVKDLFAWKTWNPVAESWTLGMFHQGYFAPSIELGMQEVPIFAGVDYDGDGGTDLVMLDASDPNDPMPLLMLRDLSGSYTHTITSAGVPYPWHHTGNPVYPISAATAVAVGDLDGNDSDDLLFLQPVSAVRRVQINMNGRDPVTASLISSDLSAPAGMHRLRFEFEDISHAGYPSQTLIEVQVHRYEPYPILVALEDTHFIPLPTYQGFAHEVDVPSGSLDTGGGFWISFTPVKTDANGNVARRYPVHGHGWSPDPDVLETMIQDLLDATDNPGGGGTGGTGSSGGTRGGWGGNNGGGGED